MPRVLKVGGSRAIQLGRQFCGRAGLSCGDLLAFDGDGDGVLIARRIAHAGDLQSPMRVVGISGTPGVRLLRSDPATATFAVGDEVVVLPFLDGFALARCETPVGARLAAVMSGFDAHRQVYDAFARAAPPPVLQDAQDALVVKLETPPVDVAAMTPPVDVAAMTPRQREMQAIGEVVARRFGGPAPVLPDGFAGRLLKLADDLFDVVDDADACFLGALAARETLALRSDVDLPFAFSLLQSILESAGLRLSGEPAQIAARLRALAGPEGQANIFACWLRGVVTYVPSREKVMSAPPILARFHPQAWQNDYAVPVDPEGDVEFDVTAHVLAMGEDAARALRDDSDASDNLRTLPEAPQWIRAWAGPYWVEVEQSIERHFDAVSSPAP